MLQKRHARDISRTPSDIEDEAFHNYFCDYFSVMCSDGDANVEAICGQGATSCTGSMRNPVCQCNHTEHFVPSLDSKSCLLGK